MDLILGAGLAGLSTSFHTEHQGCVVLEASSQVGGHVRSIVRDGYTWDEGPHVSFTRNQYVRELFSDLLDGALTEREAIVGNYDRGTWIDHPAQSNLYQVPEPTRSRCLESFLATRGEEPPALRNYEEWLDAAFGPVFAREFPHRYTRKYWTTEPRNLICDWVGGRVFRPDVNQVVRGATGPLAERTHYVTRYRYPQSGGYGALATAMARGADVRLGAHVMDVDLDERRVRTADGRVFDYERLVSTIPLPEFLLLVRGAPPDVLEAARALSCTELVLVDVEVPRPCPRPEHWVYVYDEDKWSTRITIGEHLTEGNAPRGCSAVQVEVYFSRYRPRDRSLDDIGGEVVAELAEMGLALAPGAEGQRWHVRHVRWANVLYDHRAGEALNVALTFLEEKGLQREADDLAPMTTWVDTRPATPAAPLMLAGRYAQWKYYWSDDCVLRGRDLAERLIEEA